ncbi:MAG: M20/M25/M40 family metallo-hydrolase [Acinetobacter sp.]
MQRINSRTSNSFFVFLFSGMVAISAHAEQSKVNPIPPTVTPIGKAAPQSPLKYRELAKSILAEFVAIDTTNSKGSTTKLAEAAKKRLIDAGFDSKEIHIIQSPNTARKGNLVVGLQGTDSALKPLLLTAHIDVVEVNPSDWALPPFEFNEKNGVFYGRGVEDDKDEAAIYLANLIRFKQEGYRPKRSIVVALTTDEEGGGENGIDLLLKDHPDLVNAAFVFNEGGGGKLNQSGQRTINGVQAAEKQFQNFTFEVKDRGGHSSRPREQNAIRELSAALAKISTTFVPVKLNDVTRGYLERSSSVLSEENGKAAKALATNPNDVQAINQLSKDSALNAVIRSTCTPTLISGGHASNALPEKATATVNCRLVPGDTPQYILTLLKQTVANPHVDIQLAHDELKPSPPSPVTGQILKDIEKVSHEMWANIPVVPTMGTGATESSKFRALGIPAYGVSGLFYGDETGQHGINERIPAQSFYEGQEFLYRLTKLVSSK